MSITLDGTNGITASNPATVKANAFLDASGGNTATINGAIPAPATSPTLTTPIISGNLGAGGANYGTSGQVLTSGGSGASPSWASRGLASVVATSKSRTSGTSYQNTTSGWLFVSYAGVNNGANAYLAATPGAWFLAGSSNATYTGAVLMVPPGYYYYGTYSSLYYWVEGQA